MRTQADDPATKVLLRRLAARRSHEIRGALEARCVLGLFVLLVVFMCWLWTGPTVVWGSG